MVSLQPAPDERAPLQAIERFHKKPTNSWLSTVRFGLVCLAIVITMRAVAPTYAIEGESMAPTFHNGGRVILNGAYGLRSPERGDIVVFRPPFHSGNPYIKRVIGLPGDEIAIRDGDVYLNGAQLREDYVGDGQTFCGGAAHCDLTVPVDTIYVLGDNRANSSDSRFFGPVPIHNVIGDVLVTVWPPEKIDYSP